MQIKKCRLGERVIMSLVEKRLDSHLKIICEFMDKNEKLIYKVANEITSRLKKGNKILIFGNGGSAADAQHIAGEFINRFLFDRPAIPAIALTTDTSVMTAISNDSNYEDIFSRQVHALIKPDDICIGISTSGNSLNVFRGLEDAEGKGYIISFLGNGGGLIAKHINGNHFIVPSNETPRIQECHILLAHILCELIEKKMYNEIK